MVRLNIIQKNNLKVWCKFLDQTVLVSWIKETLLSLGQKSHLLIQTQNPFIKLQNGINKYRKSTKIKSCLNYSKLSLPDFK